VTDLRTREEIVAPVRRGAHRPAPNPALTVLPVLLVVGAVAVLVVGIVLFMGLGGQSPAATSSAAATTAAPAEPVLQPLGTDASASSTDALEAAAETAEQSAPAEPSASATEAPTPTATPDTDVPVVVLNSTRTSGLAASTARDLEADGWTVPTTGNERGGEVATTVVSYPDPELEVTARAVAESLGGAADVVLDEDAEDGAITVVVGADRAA